ncbi:MAG: glycosyltransferase [Saprospiraceae bacterium]
MEISLYISFFLCLGIQWAYLYGVFRPLEEYRNKSTISASISSESQSVSIIIIVKNEIDNLRVLLPLLINQDYDGDFDIYIIDDHSTDETSEWINTLQYIPQDKIKYHVLPESLEGKKQALSYALNLPTHSFLLMTDADCRPVTNKWISSMTSAMSDADSIVLGYSPYLIQPGMLNGLIRLETTYTAMLYLGMALRGQPYMGVGRNLLYRKSALIQNKSLSTHRHVLSGDDDLTIDELSQYHKMSLQLDPGSFVESIPKKTWIDWINQKTRHVSTARYYQPSHQRILLLYYSSLLLSWIIPILMIWYSPLILLIMVVYKYLFFYKLKSLVSNTFLQKWSFFPWFIQEGLYVLILIRLSLTGLIKKTNKW